MTHDIILGVKLLMTPEKLKFGPKYGISWVLVCNSRDRGSPQLRRGIYLGGADFNIILSKLDTSEEVQIEVLGIELTYIGHWNNKI